MKAIQVREPGGPEKMQLVDVPTPQPGPRQALVRIAASGVNFIDVYFRKGLYKADVPIAPIQTPQEVEKDPHALFRNMIQEIPLPGGEIMKMVGTPFKMSGMPHKLRTPPPRLGEHTDEILKAIGYGGEEIEKFRNQGAI